MSGPPLARRRLAWHELPDPPALAAALAGFVAEALATRIERDGAAVLAVSGGRTPTRFFQALSRRRLAWDRVAVTLVDERWVDEDSERSNTRLVRELLLRNEAAAAAFVPLMTGDPTPEAGRAAAEAALAALPLPLAAAVLGMGDDGHTASFFPGGDRLAEALAPPAGRLVETQRAPAAGEARLTLTLPPLLAADRLAIHIEGDGKRRVLERALTPGPLEEMPIRAVLASPRPQTDVFWCP